jgi:hypothetical protein
MSHCWAYRAARLGLAAAISLTLAVPPASARLYVGRHLGRHLGSDSGTVVKSVRISDRGVEIQTNADNSTGGMVFADSIGHGRIYVEEGAGMVRLFSDATVKQGEHVDGDVVAVFGNVHIAGTVSGSAVAVLGSVDFTPGGSVGGDAVAVGGGVMDNEDAHIGGQTVSVGMMPLTFGLPAMPITIAFIGLGWLITLFFAWVFAALFPERLARVAVTSSRRTAASLIVGLLSGPLVPVIAVLLMVTVIGLPIGLMLPIVYVATVYAGQIAALHVLGCKLLRRPLADARSVAPVLAGSLLVALFFVLGTVLWGMPGPIRTVAVFFHLVGGLMLFALSSIGTGAFLLSRFGSRPRDLGEPSPPGTTEVTPAQSGGPAPVTG